MSACCVERWCVTDTASNRDLDKSNVGNESGILNGNSQALEELKFIAES